MMGDSGNMLSGGGLFMWLFWLLLIVIIVAVARALVGNRSATGPAAGGSPLEILQKRYARGEIDEQEFKRRRRELKSQP